MNKLLYAFIIALILGACSQQTSVKKSIDVHWQLNGNLVNNKGEAEWLLTLTNTSDENIPATGWEIYFNVIQSLYTENDADFEINHGNGDMRVLTPKPTFKGLAKGESVSFKILSNGSVLNVSDIPVGFFMVYGTEPDKAYDCNFTHTPLPLTGMDRAGGDILPVHTPEIAYTENENISKLKENSFCPIIPSPVSYTEHNGELVMNGVINIKAHNNFTNEAAFLKNELSKVYAGEVSLNEQNALIEINYSSNIVESEAYSLEVSENKITIAASTTNGAFYGVQSLLGLLPAKTWESKQNQFTFKNMLIQDEPRFAYRGLFLDAARNFHSKQQVLKLIDLMAFYKLNKFHFHICDDEGWRVEIDGLPELTEYGAFRGYSVNETKYLQPSFGSGSIAKDNGQGGSGYYSRTDFVEIVKYAHERHIEVIPEIDMPGHARAAIKSMQVRHNKYMQMGDTLKARQYLLSDANDQSEYRSVQGWNDNVVNVGMESTYAFLAKITDEMVNLFNEAGATLKTIHTGGDEVPHGVWEKSPECLQVIESNEAYNSAKDLSKYFITRFAKLLDERGLVAAGWEEIALLHDDEIKPNPELVGKNLQPTVWNNTWNSGAEDIGYQLANAGYPVVLAHVTNFYFDLAYHKHPEELGYYWGNFIDTRKPWEYTPYDITKCASIDHFGRPVDAEKLKAEMEVLTEEGKQNILGVQGLLWSENSKSAEINDYQIFPKLLGLAERAWAKQPEWASSSDKNNLREEDWNVFVNKVGQYHFSKLSNWHGGVNYRIPTPGAKIIDGVLHANVRYPGLQIRYTINGEEPTLNSELYTNPVKVTDSVILKSFNEAGRASRSVKVTLE